MGARRTYRSGELHPGAVGAFAGAAVLATLTPDDWQIAQDAESVAARLARRVGGPASHTVEVGVVVHSDSVTVSVTDDAPPRPGRHAGGTVEVVPRRPFATSVSCALVRRTAS
jgi:hypothetical protein